MFTGIIKALGTVAATDEVDDDLRLTIDIADTPLATPALGDSVAINGVCLTATTLDANRFVADVSRETLGLTTLGTLQAGAPVNLEPALAAGDPLGGHLVSGHVDGIGELVDKAADARSWRLVFSVPKALARFIAVKGSICVDGISLTVNEVSDNTFGVNIVPHTMTHTNLGGREIGAAVNLEIDVIARYLDRLMATREPGA